MLRDGYQRAAATLAASDADLPELVEFVRAYDPTAELRAAWGTNYQTRLDYLMRKSYDTFYLGKEFPGSHAEVLLCMATWVAAGPPAGVPASMVKSYLRNFLLELA